MIRLTLWVPLDLSIVCNSGGIAVGGAVKWHSSIFYVCVDVPLQHKWILWQHLQPTKTLHLVFQTGSQISMHKTGCTFDGKTKRLSPAFSVGCSLPGRTVETKRDADVFFSSPFTSCQSAPTSLHQQERHAHTHTNMCAPYTCAHCSMQSLISQLQQIRTNVIVFDPKCAGALGKQWHICLMLAVC